MGIIASASVPPASRIIDANTVDLAAIPRQGNNGGRFPVNPGHVEGRASAKPESPVELGRRIWELNRDRRHPLSDAQIGQRIGASPDEVNAAVAAYLATRPGVAESLTLGRSVDARLNADPHATYAEVARELSVTLDEALDARNDLICWTEGAYHLLRKPEQCVNSVDWCERNCQVRGWGPDAPEEYGHGLTLVEAEVADGSVVGGRRRLIAELQQFDSPELPGGGDYPTVYLSTGDTDEYGVKLELEEAEALALALLSGVRAARAARNA